jgi:hypothetical protein
VKNEKGKEEHGAFFAVLTPTRRLGPIITPQPKGLVAWGRLAELQRCALSLATARVANGDHWVEIIVTIRGKG